MIRRAALAIMLLALPAHAQDPEPPAGQRIQLAPAAAAKFTVTFRGPRQPDSDAGTEGIAIDDESADAGRTVLEVEISGETARATTRGSDGKTSEIFMFRELFLRLDESSGKVRPYKFDQYAPADMRFTRSFPGVDWVLPAHFKGKTERAGIACLHFVQEAGSGGKPAASDDDDALAYDNRHAKKRREAWFAAATGLPLAFDDGEVSGSYRHSPAPTEPVILPKAHTDAVRYYYGLK